MALADIICCFHPYFDSNRQNETEKLYCPAARKGNLFQKYTVVEEASDLMAFLSATTKSTTKTKQAKTTQNYSKPAQTLKFQNIKNTV